ncbi:MAG: two-component system, OmpR family, sensor kinase, partial [Solirubrobacteraceae bacterium]|nr:two-component system, OmpR family, sensor kinase [Solirubrobacteraceae bacterium]
MYLGVAPSLESNLRAQRLDSLERAGRRYSPPVRAALDRSASVSVVDRLVRHAADTAGARVTLLAVTHTAGGPQLAVRSDSTADVDIVGLRFGVAQRAARSGVVERGTENGATGSVAEVALPLRITPPGSRRAGVYYVAVFSQPLQDVGGGVALIRARILVAGAIALALAILAGSVLARSIARRVRRMEDAARRVAQGDFTAGFELGARDELGRLALTLDGMQRQL